MLRDHFLEGGLDRRGGSHRAEVPEDQPLSEQNDDFVSFEKALRDLSMQSAELKKLVSEGEIRAFRDGQSMKFKREDISQTLN